jgi:hypothetical protein
MSMVVSCVAELGESHCLATHSLLTSDGKMKVVRSEQRHSPSLQDVIEHSAKVIIKNYF